MKKLLQINTVLNSDSPGRIAEEIGRLAISDGWKSYIAYGRNPRESQSEPIRIGRNIDIYYHVLKTRITDRHGFASQSATRKLIDRIKHIQPDVIHLHNLHGYYLNIQILFEYLSQLSIPIVWTLHDCWPFTGHCSYFDYIDCRNWKTQCHDCPQKNKYPVSWVFDSSEKNFIQKKYYFNAVPNLVLVPVSNWLNTLLKDSFLQNQKSYVIHNGIDTEVFLPKNDAIAGHKYNLGSKPIILGVANAWIQRKGFQDFLDLSKLLDEEHQIVLVGLSKKQINGLPPNITGIEKTDNVNELADLYAAADIYFNPTWEDNFPTTNLEALSCGTPVLTYKTGGSIEAITPETGFISEKGDLTTSYAIIKKVIMTGKDKYTDICRKRVVESFNKHIQYAKYLRLYESLTK
jgi:glycosyltransferase involved in cell wall biosynthesis